MASHRYNTRSKARRAKSILATQTECPISREPFTADTIVYTHALVNFDAVYLRDYLLACPGSSNPVNRAPFMDADVEDLQRLCACSAAGAQLLKGDQAQQAKARQLEEANNIFFFENECKNALHRLATQWHAYDDEFHNAIALFRNALVEIRRDVLTCANGRHYWGKILQELRLFCSSQQQVPKHADAAVHATFDYMQRPDTMPYLVSDIESDYSDDTSSDDESSALVRSSTQQPPPYSAVSPAVASFYSSFYTRL